IEGASASAAEEECFWSDMSVTEHVDKYIAAGVKKNDAIKAAAADRGIPKRDIYNEYHTGGSE
ncbi:MAG: rRNA (cytidine-2'-O-)-methyltransferase, partial [Clostridia bacterium]|nr:rRNA (cytidine-2'-O-)-methyltransferase [Clostridia bacterium]